MFYFIKNGCIALAFKSLFWSLCNFKNDWKNRQVVQKRLRRIPDSELFEYFINYPNLLSYVASMPPLKWIIGNESRFVKSVNQLTDAYYRDHKVP